MGKHKGGQKSTFTQERGVAICTRLANGESLLSICDDMGIAYSTARKWEMDIPEHGADSMRAREIGCHAMADQQLQIADDGRNDWMERNAGDDSGWAANGENIQRSRLRIETRMRLLGKWLPKIYGDRLNLDHSGSIGIGERYKRAEERLKKPTK
jgi:hypothetical protein